MAPPGSAFFMFQECVHTAARLVKTVASNGVEMFACQCVNCGRKATDWIPKKLIKHPEAIPDENSKTPTIRELMAPALKELKALRLTTYEIRRSLYDNYLGSPQWKSLRRAILARAGNVCERCHIRPATQGHHLTYERLGNETLSDLLAVCRDCHEELHGIEKKEAIG